MKAYRLALLSCVSIFALISCGGGSEKKDFTDIVFNSTEVTYDGKEHTITPTGVPSFAHVTYNGELEEPPTYINVGAHDISIKVTADGYNDYSKTATLTIKEGSLYDIIVFEDVTVPYDGESHTIEATGIPEGAEYNYSIVTVNYREKTPPTFTDAGEYYIKLDVDAEGYEHYTKTVKLTISPAEISGVTFESQTVAYDGNPHTIKVKNESGLVLDVTYSPNTPFTDIGKYTIKATVKKKNYETLELEATLTIESSEVKRNIYHCGNTLYFQNAKDHNRLYALRDDSSDLVKVSNDNAIDIIPTGNSGDDEVAYIDNSSLLPAIKYAKYNDGTETFEALNELSRDCRYLQTDGICYYYAVNSPVKDQSGIYKLSLADDQVDETRLYQGNTYFLQLVDNNIYFASGEDKILSYIDSDGEDQEATHIQNDGKDVKIKNLSYLDGALYYTGEDGIYQYTIASASFNKLVDAAVGVDFSLVNNDLYYVVADNSLIYGSSIHKVNITTKDDNVVVTATSPTLSSLTSDGTYLYYYDTDKLIRCGLDGSDPADLLDDFEPTESVPTTARAGQTSFHNGIVYYLDAYDNDTLHSYNPANQCNTRLTSNKVTNYSFVGDTLYASTIYHSPDANVTYAFDLDSGVASLFLNEDTREIVSDGDYLYYCVAKKIYQCELDGSNPQEVFAGEENVRNLRIAGKGLYFISHDLLYTIDLNNISEGAKQLLPEVTVPCFDISSEYIYYRNSSYEMDGGLARCELDGSKSEILVAPFQPLTMKFHKDSLGIASIYYYVNFEGSRGLYYVTVSGLVYGPFKLTELDAYHPMTFDVNDYGICFSDYSLGIGGDMHTYYYDFSASGDPICIDW